MPTRGADLHAIVWLDLADTYQGARRVVRVRAPAPNQYGRVVTEERTVTVAIARGGLAGEQIRLAGQACRGGGAGMAGAAGDLVLEIAFNPSARYRLEGRDVFETLAVAPWEAALGGQIDVPTPSGQVAVNLPGGSQTGRKLRLKGRGSPGGPPGDLYLVLDVVLPPASSERAREAYRAMAREMPFNPRAPAPPMQRPRA